MVDINLLTLESLRQNYRNLSRTNLCILCRFQSNLFLISTSLCHCNQVILRSNVHRNRIARGIICSYGNIQVGFLYNGNGSILRNRAVLIQCNLFVLYKFSQSLRLVVCRNRSGVRQLGRSYAFADISCISFIRISDCTTQICLSSALLGIGRDFVFVLNFNGANLVLVAVLITCYASLAGYAVSGRVNGEVAAGDFHRICATPITKRRCCKITISNGNFTNTIAALTIAKYTFQTSKCTTRNRKLTLICSIVICTVSKRILTNKRTARNCGNIPVQNGSSIRCILIVGTIKSTARNI